MKQPGEQPDLPSFLEGASEQLNSLLEQNLSLRMKFPTEAPKFYPSEESIHELLVAFESKLEETEEHPHAVISQLVDSKFLIPLVKTLDHPNLDINVSAVGCFHALVVDMSDEVEQMERNEGEGGQAVQTYAMYFRMAVWFIENGLTESLVKIMDRLDEEKIEEYEACRKVLKVLEALLQLSDTVYPILVRDTAIIAFLANRIMPNFTVSHRVIDDNKFIASDILLALLQTPEVEQGLSAVRQFFKSFGVEVIIETISSYENKLPTEIDQREFLMNLFDCLNVLLVSIRETRLQFSQMKGAYLMVSYICVKSEYAVAALKALSNSLDNELDPEHNAALCEEIVNDGSLKYLFPVLMMQGLKAKDDEEQEDINEHILRVLYFLLRNAQGVARDRVLYKFTEKNFAKMERVLELRVENSSNLEKSKSADITPDEYLQMIKEEGLALVELCDKIILSLWGCSAKLKQRIKQLLPLFSIAPQDLRACIERQYQFIDEGVEKQALGKMIAGNLRELLQE